MNYREINPSMPALPKTQASSYPGDSGEPTLIVLCSWTGAYIEHVRYYATKYKRLFPSTPILLITTSPQDVLRRSSRKRKEQLALAVRLLHVRSWRDGDDKEARKEERILMHVLSDGGSFKACELTKAYLEAHQTRFPISALILDSTPGIPRYPRYCKALAKAVARNPALQCLCRLPVYVALGTLWIVYRACIGFENNQVSRTGKDLLDVKLFDSAVPHCYLYSTQDTIVAYEDVKQHVVLAKSRYPVTECVFDSSDHVMHGKVYPEEYWSSIYSTWTGREGVWPDDGSKVPLYDCGIGIFTSWQVVPSTV